MLLHRIVVDMVATDDGDMVVEASVEGEPAFVTALGMLDIARDFIYRSADEEEV